MVASITLNWTDDMKINIDNLTEAESQIENGQGMDHDDALDKVLKRVQK